MDFTAHRLRGVAISPAACWRADPLMGSVTRRDTAAPIVFVAHRMAQAVVTLHGTTQSAGFTPQNALIESSYLAATFMLTFGLKVAPARATRPVCVSFQAVFASMQGESSARGIKQHPLVHRVGVCVTHLSVWHPLMFVK